MPAIVTHECFAREAYDLLSAKVGTSKDCREAFILGNQGPDPLFYCMVDPQVSQWSETGYALHRGNSAAVLAAMKHAVNFVPQQDKDVARAYALGFMCHYLLDSTVHPLVYAQQYAMCDAGVAGLTRENGTGVHATIECEWDEVMVATKLNSDLQHFSPAKELLHASRGVLKTISTMYSFVILTTQNQLPPTDIFVRSVKLFRAAQVLFYSKRGIKRWLIARTEETLNTYSSYASLSMRPGRREESAFENRAHDEWTDPATAEKRTESFGDLYARALSRVVESAELLLSADFNADVAEKITHGLDFNGLPAGGVLLTTE